MKRNKFIFVLLLLISISAVAYGSTFLYLKVNNKGATAYDDTFVIMTSCNPVYIATSNVVGDIDGVVVENLSQPTTGCLHDYTLTTQDMKNLSKADVLVINGGGMEGYLDNVMTAYPELTIIDASADIAYIEGEEHDHGDDEEVEHIHEDAEEAYHDHEEADNLDHDHDEAEESGHNHNDIDVDVDEAGYNHDEIEDVEHTHEDVEDLEHAHEDVEESEHDHEENESHDHASGESGHNHENNSHVWMSLDLYQQEVEAIAAGLSQIDTEHASDYNEAAASYIASLQEALAPQIKALQEKLSGQPIVVLHEAYDYIAQDVGAEVVGTLDLDEERQVSAGEVADIIGIIDDKQVGLVLAEEDYGSDMGGMIMAETSAKVVYLNTLIHGTYEADDYAKVMADNYKLILQALE